MKPNITLKVKQLRSTFNSLKTITWMLGYGASILLPNYKIIRAPLTQPTLNHHFDVGLRRVYTLGEL